MLHFTFAYTTVDRILTAMLGDRANILSSKQIELMP